MTIITRHTLSAYSLHLNLNIPASNEPQIHLIYLPPELLRPSSQYELTISKINGWPVDIYTRIIPPHAATEAEARKYANQLIRQELFFTATPSTAPSIDSLDEEDSDDADPTPSSNNLFHKTSHARGLDVEKLYFRVKEGSSLPVGSGYWLLFGIKAAGVWTGPTFPHVYSSFPLQFDLQPLLYGIPWPLFPLSCLIAVIVIVYFGLLRRYHLRLFQIK